MGSELELNFGIAKLKVEFNEFFAAVKTLGGAVLLGAPQQKEVRVSLQAMIVEVSKSYETINEAITPLYAMDTQQKFTDQFGDVRADLKSKRALLSDVARTHCHVVEDKLTELNKRREWMKNKPIVNRAYERLEKICVQWLSRDWELVRRLESYFDLMNSFVDEVASIRAENEADAFSVLQDGLKQIEDDVLAVGRMLGELKVITQKL